jgi:hypothetical protein
MPDIDEILQTQLEAIESGQPVEDILQALPNDVQDLEPLIKLASAVRELPHPEFEFEKAQATRQKILAASQAVTRPALRRRPAQGLNLRWLSAPGFATLAAVFLATLIMISALGIWLAGPPGGRSALVLDVNGRVEAASIQNGSEWRQVYSGDRIFSGERLRTYGASKATLVFYEGSRAAVGSNADLVLDTIEGRWDRSLQVEIAQNRGVTDHSVVSLQGKNSSYVVQAPGASASVLGTTFSVAVLDNGQSHFAVRTGKVQVSNDRSQVFITAGQATLAQPNQTLESPAYTFSVAGQMTSIAASSWTVEGVSFTINENTSIHGSPVVGDDLIVTGRITANNEYIADTIEVALIPQPLSSFTGEIQHQDEDLWQVSDHKVLVNEATTTAGALRTGDPVIVTFSVLKDGSRLARSIVSLDEAAETIPDSVTPSPVPGARPALRFEPQEMTNTCESTLEYKFEGSLVNTGDTEDDFAANVKLGWLFERGAEYVEEIELSTASWLRIDGGETVKFNLYVTPKESWQAADGRDKHIILRVIIEQETNRPEHLNARLTINMTTCEEVELTLDPTSEEEPTPKPSRTPTPQSTPDFCDSGLIHPTGIRLANRYSVPYEEIMDWFCRGYGFGEIDLVYLLAEQTEYDTEEIFELKEPGKAWGTIKQELLEKEKEKISPPGLEKTPPGLDKKPPGLEEAPPGLEKTPRPQPVIPTKKPTNTSKP